MIANATPATAPYLNPRRVWWSVSFRTLMLPW